MGLKEHEGEGSSVPLHGFVSHILPSEKYARVEVMEPTSPEIEMELFAQTDIKQDTNYHKLTQLEDPPAEHEISLDDEKIQETLQQDEDKGDTELLKTYPDTLLGKVYKFKDKNMVKIAWGCIFLGVFCTAWIGPCFKLLGNEGVAAARRASWRQQVLLLLLLIPTYFEYRSLTAQQKRDLFNKTTLLQLLLCGFLWFCDLFLWSNSLDYTTVSRSSVFGNTGCLMIMAWSLIRRQPFSGLEILGGIIGFGGLVIGVVGTNIFFASAAETAAKSPLKGDFLALGSALCVAIYVLNATKVRTKVSLFVYTFSNTVFLFVVLSVASFAVEGTKFDTSTDGIFGWVDVKYVVVVGLLSVVAGLIGFNLNNVGLRYVPAIGCSLVTLCDPFISGTYAWMIGSDGLPGVFTLVGGVITISGIVVLVVGQEKRKKREKLQKEEEETKANEAKVVEFTVSDGLDG